MLKLNPLITLFCLTGLAAAQVRADEPSVQDKLIRSTRKSIYYTHPGIPYPIRFIRNSSCNFTARELELIASTFSVLPPVYQNISIEFHIEKTCELDPETDTFSESSSDLMTLKDHLASTYSDHIELSDRIFSYYSRGRLLKLEDTFSRKIIAHELTHMLDNEKEHSDEDHFRLINQWTSILGFSDYDEEKAEGFYREQGWVNPKEDLATSAEGYFFDPNFICNQPAMFSWFANHVGPTTVAPSTCPDLKTPLDPDKITSVGFMFLSGTDRHFESRWGHAALHFYDNDKDPFNDMLIEAGGGIEGAPAISGYEKPDELVEKRKELEKLAPSAAEILAKGALGQLQMNISPLKFKLKWLEAVVIEGRDIRERVLRLNPNQLKALIYIIDRDARKFQERGTKYGFLSFNCSTYVAESLDKAVSQEVVTPNWLGVYTPPDVYEQLNPLVARDLPVMEGDLSRLRRLVPSRQKMIKKLSKMPQFATIQWEALKEADDPELARAAKDELLKFVQVTRDLVNGLPPTDPEREQWLVKARGFVYTFTVEFDPDLQQAAVHSYKSLYQLTPSAP